MGLMPGDHSSYHLVYYCSGHGYGHATRVSAFARHLLSLDPPPTVHIVSSAPKQVFTDSVAVGALYRNADIDPVIVQPLAYRVDRQKSVEVLQSFLRKKDMKVLEESQWLKDIGADCVLSDAAFLGCLAAHQAGIPSVLISNFSFDSVYSYLSTPFIDAPPTPEPDLFDGLPAQVAMALPPDIPISEETLAPLVDEILSGFRCADLLLRLPGAIPMPSFSVLPGLPSPSWVDLNTRTFTEEVITHLKEPPSSHLLHPCTEFSDQYASKSLPRTAISAPLLVRSPNPSVYTAEGRRRLLNIVGVPPYLHNPEQIKILVVSFGGQVFRKPSSRIHSRSPSRAGTPGAFASAMTKSLNGIQREVALSKPSDLSKEYFPDPARLAAALRSTSLFDGPASVAASPGLPPPKPMTTGRASSLKIPGAPPVAVPMSPPNKFASKSPGKLSLPALHTIPPSPVLAREVKAQDTYPGWSSSVEEENEEDLPRLLPDDTWVAIVCGVSKEWGRENGEELPPGFYVAPRDIYMPDLTAVADALLGKLGYGTVSECVDACTPFVYVPRPLFIEEHGLRLLLESEGVGVELSRSYYEKGEWADAVQEAYVRGRDAKAKKRQEGETGKRRKEGREMARGLLDWLDRWKAGTRAMDPDPQAEEDTADIGHDNE
ncbi:uncharacterized protein B0H18DRAFT_246196 [Fomitopsis serialis]|uniref:uncharacterized protein n=1 Tax=Fomitopsis serialis TaxID=139415 RepID=UPI002008A88F|nr:uncharacterized protein B0H18DRAFT_246196 [Neoantrodia serialis]KAH9928700.1 hypothetical protein B0H18DRAFT_246196 [Neoantrodia serialis]